MSEQSVTEAMEKARERLGASQALLDTEFYTDSVSRSYYAILDSARALLMTADILPKTHSGTLRKFSELFIKTGKFNTKFSTILGQIEKERVEADYNYLAHFSKEEATAVLQDATEFVKVAEEYIKKPL